MLSGLDDLSEMCGFYVCFSFVIFLFFSIVVSILLNINSFVSMSTFANSQSWPVCALKDRRPLVKFWDQTFGSPSLDYEQTLKLCDFYGFRSSVCDNFESLRQCLEVVRNLFCRHNTFAAVNDNCKGAVMRFLGFSEPKNLQFGSVVRKMTLAFSSFEEVLDFDFSDNSSASLLGKDVLRIFQAILGIPILDSKFPKSSHLGYLAHSQRVFQGEDGVGGQVGCTMGGIAPVDVSSLKTVAQFPCELIAEWTLRLPHEDSFFYGTASNGLLMMLAFLSGCGDSGADWTEDMVVEFVRYVDCDGVELVRCSYMTSVLLRRLDDADSLSLLRLFSHKEAVVDAAHALSTLLSIGASGEISLVREDETTVGSLTGAIPTRSVLASAPRQGLPAVIVNPIPMCQSCPEIDPATEEGWIERQAARADYRLWDVQALRDWLGRRVGLSQVGVLKHTVLLQISAWMAGNTGDVPRRLSPSEPEVPFLPIEYHNTRQLSDDVCDRVFAISTLNKLSLYVIQAEMAVLSPSFRCPLSEKTTYVRALLDAYPIRASGEAKRNSWSYLQRSRVPSFTKCTWPEGVRDEILVALPFFDSANEGAEPTIAYYGLTQQYHGEDTVLLGVINATTIVPSRISMSKGDVVAVCFASTHNGNHVSTTPTAIPFSAAQVFSQSGTAEVQGSGFPSSVHASPFVGHSGVSNFSNPLNPFPSVLSDTSMVFPVNGLRLPLPAALDRSGTAVGVGVGDRPSHAVDVAGMPGLTLVAREQPSRAKGDRTLKALMIADAFIRTVSVDPVRVLSMVMAEVFLSLVTHTGILTQLALVEVTQILQSVNFPSYALAIPLTMSPRHDVTQALTTAKLFVGWRSEEAFPESRAARFDYRSNDPMLVYRILWTIFRIRYGFFAFHTEIWDALVRYAARCEKVVRDLFHWTQGAVDFMIKKALRDLEMIDDRVGLTVPSALVAPSPDAVQACPILDRYAYCNAIDLLPDMHDPIAYYTHHQLVMQAQQLHSEGLAVRYVVPLAIVPPFRLVGGVGKHGAPVYSVVAQQSHSQQASTLVGSPRVTKKDRSVNSIKKRRIDGAHTSGPVAMPMTPPVSTVQRLPVAKNRPCHQWLSTIGCSRGATCRFDHAAPTTKSVWNFCRDELVKLGLTAGLQMGLCPPL